MSGGTLLALNLHFLYTQNRFNHFSSELISSIDDLLVPQDQRVPHLTVTMGGRPTIGIVEVCCPVFDFLNVGALWRRDLPPHHIVQKSQGNSPYLLKMASSSKNDGLESKHEKDDHIEDDKNGRDDQDDEEEDQDDGDDNVDNDGEGDDDDEDGENDDDEGDNDGDEESDDDEILQELQKVKHKRDAASSSSSSAPAPSKKARRDSGANEEEDEPEFVNESYEDINTSDIIPRAKRKAAIRSGLVRHTPSDPAPIIEADCSEEEAEF